MNVHDVLGIRATKVTSTSRAHPSRDLCQPAGLVVPPAVVVCLDIDVFQYFSKQRFQIGCWCANTIVLVFVISSQAFSLYVRVCMSVCGGEWQLWSKAIVSLSRYFQSSVPNTPYECSIIQLGMISSRIFWQLTIRLLCTPVIIKWLKRLHWHHQQLVHQLLGNAN